MYGSIGDLKKSVPERTLAQLTDDEAGTDLQDEVVNEAIMAADEVIDAHLAGSYDLPFAETPPILKRISADIAIFHLWCRRPEGEVPEAIETKYKNAVRMLEAFQSGKLTLGTTVSGENLQAADAYRTDRKRERIFK